jgi:hypothetical protein
MMADDPPPPTSSRKNEKMGTLVSSEAELRRRPASNIGLSGALGRGTPAARTDGNKIGG